jgi:hypothetical protein
LKNKLCIGFYLLMSSIVYAQPRIQLVDSSQKASYRGLSVVDNNIVWVSGSNGTVGKSTNGGKSWQWMHPKGYEKSDFRDIEAFDANTAFIMGITQPAVILKTKDGGLSWQKVFEDTTKAAFFDAMSFSVSENDTIVGLIGDPIKKVQYVAMALVENENLVWKTIEIQDAEVYDTSYNEKTHFASVVKDEAFFASSGTNIALIDPIEMTPILGFMVSGGKKTSLMHYPVGYKYEIPMISGKSTTGANSIAIFKEKNKGVIVGGDFAIDTLRDGNMVLFDYSPENLKPTFSKPNISPHGYRSCVIYVSENKLITCGTSGIDISEDGGMNWQLISKESYHVVQKAKKGDAIFLVGDKGRIAKLMP